MIIIENKHIFPIVPILLSDIDFASSVLNFNPNTTPTIAKIIVMNKTPVKSIAKSISLVKRIEPIKTIVRQIATIKI